MRTAMYSSKTKFLKTTFTILFAWLTLSNSYAITKSNDPERRLNGKYLATASVNPFNGISSELDKPVKRKNLNAFASSLIISWDRPIGYGGTTATYLRVGYTVDIKVTVYNNVSDIAYGAVANFPLPAGYKVVKYTVLDKKTSTTTEYTPEDDGPYNTATGKWQVGDLTRYSANGKLLTVTVELLPTGETIVDPPTVSSIDNPTIKTTSSSSKFSPSRIEQFLEGDSSIYLSTQDNPSLLTTMDINQPEYPQVEVGRTSVGAYNAMGYHPKERYIYAIRYKYGNSVSQIDNLQSRAVLMVIDRKGRAYPLVQLAMSQAYREGYFFAGEIDPDGNFFVRAADNDAPMIKIDVKTFSVTVASWSIIPKYTDLAWNNGYLYTVADDGFLYRIDPYNSSATSVVIGRIPNNIGNKNISGTNVFGAMYGSSNKGYIFGSTNDGKGFYRIDITPQAKPTDLVKIYNHTKVGSSNNNDGAHDVTKLLVFPSDLGIKISSVQKCVSGGTTLRYTVEVINHGFTRAAGTKVMLAKWLTGALPGFVPTASNFRFTAVHSSTNTSAPPVNNNPTLRNILTPNDEDITSPYLELIEKTNKNDIFVTTFNVEVDVPTTLIDELNLSVEVVAPEYISDPDEPGRQPNRAEMTMPVSVPINDLKISSDVVCVNGTAPTLTASKAGTWTSNNPGVASVTSAGVITLVSAGTTSFSFTPTLTPDCPPSPVSLTVNGLPPSPTATVTQHPTCANPSGVITITAPTNDAGLYKYELKLLGATPQIFEQTTRVFNDLAPGNYELRVLFASNGCGSTPPISLTVNQSNDQPSTPVASATQPTCINPQGQINATSSLTADEEFVLTKPDGTKIMKRENSFQNLADGNYSLSVRNTVTFCESPKLNFVLAKANVIANAGSDFTITCSTNANGGRIGVASAAGFTYSWTSTSGSFSGSTEANPLVNPNVTTTYKLTITNTATGCTAEDEVTVTVNKTVPTANAGLNKLITCVSNTSGVTIGTPAISGYTYQWLAAEGMPNDQINLATPTVTPTITTTYRLTVTNLATGCTSQAQVTVVVNNDVPVFNIPDDYTINCIKNSNGIVAIGDASTNSNYTYEWQPAVGLNTADLNKSNPSVNPATNTTYYVKVTNNESGCFIERTIDVIVDKTAHAPLANASLTLNCNDQLNGVQIGPTAEEGYAYTWSPSTGLSDAGIANPIAKPLVNTIYTLTITNENTGCETQVSYNLSLDSRPSQPTYTIAQPTCTVSHGKLTINSPSGLDLIYVLQPEVGLPIQSNTKVFDNLAPGEYILTVRSSTSQCTSTPIEFYIDELPRTPATPIVTTTQPSCEQPLGKIEVDTPTASDITYRLSSTKPNFTPFTQVSRIFGDLADGTYTITALQDGCASASTTVVLNAPPSVPEKPVATIIHPVCGDTSATITVTSPTSAVAGVYEYTLTRPLTGTKITQESPVFTGIAGGITYVITVKDLATGCTSLSSESLKVNGALTVPNKPVATVTQPTCSVSTGTVVVNTPTGSGLRYILTGITPAVSAKTQTTTTFGSLSPGVYSLTVVNSDSCTASETITINATPVVPATPTASVTSPGCGQTTGKITVNSPQPALGLTYTLTSTNSAISPITQELSVFDDILPGTYNVTATSADGCKSGISLNLVVANPPAVPSPPNITITQPMCGETVGKIKVNSPTGTGITYTLTGSSPTVGPITQSDVDFGDIAPGQYQIIARNASGCTSSVVSFTINQGYVIPSKPTVLVTQPTCITPTGTVTVQSPAPSADIEYILRRISTGTMVVQKSNIFTKVAVSINYVVLVRNVNSGCTSEASDSFLINAVPTAPTITAPTLTHITCNTTSGKIKLNNPHANLVYTLASTDAIPTNYNLVGDEFVNLPHGNYILKAHNPTTLCERTLNLTINDKVLVTAPVGSVTKPNCNVTTGTITISSPAVNASTTFTLRNSSGTEIITQPSNIFGELMPGNYTVSVNNTVTGCTSTTASFTVDNVPTTPTTPTTTVTPITCNNLTATINLSAPDPTLNYTLTGPSPSANAYNRVGNTFPGLSIGTYTLRVANPITLCVTTTTIVIADKSYPNTPTATSTNPTCLAAGSITVTTPLPAANVTYTLIGTNPVVAARTQSSNQFNNLSPGTYALTTTNTTTGCASQSLTIVIVADDGIPNSPSVTITEPTCLANGSITVTNSPANVKEYIITDSSGDVISSQTTPSFNNVAPGTYFVIIKLNTGCLSTPQLVTLTPTPTIAIAGDDFIKSCNQNNSGKTIGSTSVGNHTYTWFPTTGLSNPNIADPIANPIETTIYTVTVINQITGCSATDQVTVTVINDIVPTLTVEAPVCNGNNYTVNFSTNGTVTTSAGTIVGNTIIVPLGTNITITSTGPNGCETSVTNVFSPINCDPDCTPPTSTGQAICKNDGTYSVVVNFSNDVTISTSYGTINGNIISGIPIGTDVTITSTRNGCNSEFIVKSPVSCIPICPKPTATYSAGICLGATYNIYFDHVDDAIVTASAGEVDMTLKVIRNIPMGTDVTVTSYLPNGCNPHTITIKSPTSISPLLTVISPECNGDGTYSFSFASNGRVTVSAGTIIGNKVTANIGTHVTVTATDYNGCATNVIDVKSPDDCSKTTCKEPEISSGQGLCMSNGTYTVSINFPSDAIITLSAGTLVGKNVTGVPIGHQLVITATRGECKSVLEVPSPDCSGSTCEKPFVTFSAGLCQGATYSINFANVNGATITASAGVVDMANGVITDIPMGTEVTLTATITGGCKPQVLTIQSPKCFNNPSISIVKTGQFIDENKDGYAQAGETIKYNFLIKNTGDVQLNNIRIQDFLPGVQITAGNVLFSLAPGASSNVLYTATYALTPLDIIAKQVINEVTVFGDGNDKTVEDKSRIITQLNIDENCLITIYNAVTPNGDGKNDYFKIDGIECYGNNSLQIFNRWGVLVFERQNYNNAERAFKGKSEGRVTVGPGDKLPSGVYFYILKYRENSSENKQITKTGYLYLSL